MPDEHKNFGGSLVLDFGKWWRHVKMLSCALHQSSVGKKDGDWYIYPWVLAYVNLNNVNKNEQKS